MLAHVESKNLETPDGDVWNPVGTATQALLARAWLQGRLRDTSLAKCWETIVDQDQGTALSAAGHTDGWSEVVRRVGNHLPVFRELVRTSVQLTLTPEKGDEGIVDAGSVAHAVVALREQLDPDRLPHEKTQFPQQQAEWASIAEVGRTVRKVMPPLPRHEFSRVKRHIELLELACDRRSLPQFLEEVALTIEQLRATDNRASQALLTEYKQAQQTLADKGLSDASEGSRLRKLDDFLDKTDPERRDELEKAAPVVQLEWILQIPYDDLALMGAQVEILERVLQQLWNYASTLLDESTGEGNDAPSALADTGTRLVSATEQLTRILTNKGNS